MDEWLKIAGAAGNAASINKTDKVSTFFKLIKLLLIGVIAYIALYFGIQALKEANEPIEYQRLGGIVTHHECVIDTIKANGYLSGFQMEYRFKLSTYEHPFVIENKFDKQKLQEGFLHAKRIDVELLKGWREKDQPEVQQVYADGFPLLKAKEARSKTGAYIILSIGIVLSLGFSLAVFLLVRDWKTVWRE